LEKNIKKKTSLSLRKRWRKKVPIALQNRQKWLGMCEEISNRRILYATHKKTSIQ